MRSMLSLFLLILTQSLLPDGPRENVIDRQSYVFIPPGTFQMGCSATDSQCSEREVPVHAVQITHGFWMSQAETTLAAYEEFSSATGAPEASQPGSRKRPIVGLSWNVAD